MIARHLARRSWIVVLLSAAAAFTAWFLIHDDPKTYERSLTFVVLPSAELDLSDVPDALRGLSQQTSQTGGTIASAIGSRRLLDRTSKAKLSDRYEVEAGMQPGSDLIVVRLRGPRSDVLARLTPAYARSAARWVQLNLRSYRLELLETEAPAGPVAPKVLEMTAVAAFLAAALALGVAYLEGVGLRRRSGASSSASGSTGVDGLERPAKPGPVGAYWGLPADTRIAVVRPEDGGSAPVPDAGTGSGR